MFNLVTFELACTIIFVLQHPPPHFLLSLALFHIYALYLSLSFDKIFLVDLSITHGWIDKPNHDPDGKRAAKNRFLFISPVAITSNVFVCVHRSIQLFQFSSDRCTVPYIRVAFT